MILRLIFTFLIFMLISGLGATEVLAVNNDISLFTNANKSYAGFNEQLDSIIKLQKKQRKAQKKIRSIEFLKYQTLEDEIKFQEKKKKKENDLIKRLNKLNGNSEDNADLVRSQLDKNSVDLGSLFLLNIF